MKKTLYALLSISTFFLFSHFSATIIKGIRLGIIVLTIFILVSSDLLILTRPFLLNTYFQGVFPNSNILGFYISILILPIYFNRTFQDYFIKGKIVTLNNAITFNLLILILLSGARAAMLGVGVMTFILLFRYEKNLLKRVSYILFSSALIVIVFSTTDLYQRYIVKYEGLSVFTTRGYLWSSRINGIKQRPITGWGFQVNPTHGNYREFMVSNKLEKGNMYLALVEEFGIVIGFIMILIIMYIGFMSLNVPDNMFFISLTILGALTHINFESWALNFNSIIANIFWIYILLIPKLVRLPLPDTGIFIDEKRSPNLQII